MDYVNIILGACTFLGFLLATYEFLAGKNKSEVERAKILGLTERIEHAKYSLAIVHDTVNLALQRLKKDPSKDVTDLLRVSRGSLGVSLHELEAERLRLKTWEFGKILESDWNPPKMTAPVEPLPGEGTNAEQA
jgi:hypothetical protein